MWNPALIDGPITIEGDSGYHLNAAPQVVTEALAPYIVSPATPERVFAGAETVCLRFPSEAQAKSLLPGMWQE